MENQDIVEFDIDDSGSGMGYVAYGLITAGVLAAGYAGYRFFFGGRKKDAEESAEENAEVAEQVTAKDLEGALKNAQENALKSDEARLAAMEEAVTKMAASVQDLSDGQAALFDKLNGVSANT